MASDEFSPRLTLRLLKEEIERLRNNADGNQAETDKLLARLADELGEFRAERERFNEARIRIESTYKHITRLEGEVKSLMDKLAESHKLLAVTDARTQSADKWIYGLVFALVSLLVAAVGLLVGM